MRSDADRLVARLYRAREDKRAAQQAHVAAAKQFGPCDGPRLGFDNERGCDGGERCFEAPGLDVPQWCESCRGRQPAWESYRAMSARAAAALRAVLAAGRRITQEADDATR